MFKNDQQLSPIIIIEYTWSKLAQSMWNVDYNDKNQVYKYN